MFLRELMILIITFKRKFLFLSLALSFMQRKSKNPEESTMIT